MRPLVARPRSGGWAVRWLLVRGLGLVYLVAFLSLAVQVLPLLGAAGLTPAADYLDGLRDRDGITLDLPTIFWFWASDGALQGLAWVGVGLSVAVVLGVTNAFVQMALWLLYLSFAHVGQVWYGYGWEILLLEAGFLSIWLCPWRSIDAFDPRAPPPLPILLLYRWLVFRLMLGAGLIKLRGDGCWRDLTCLDFHFETQPIPNPLSWWFHHLPPSIHAFMVGWNHVVELIVPWLCFGPRWARRIAAVVIVQFQLTLILTGNLSFFNHLTIVLCVALLDDELLVRLLGVRVRVRSLAASAVAVSSRARAVFIGAVAVFLALLGVRPALNLLSPGQRMNGSFDAWHLVNTYGAFGSVGRERYEVIVEGTRDGVEWRAYEFPCKPGDPGRRPCVISPFQPRLDWQIWFAAQQEPSENLWLVHLLYGLMRGTPEVTALLAGNPFPDGPPVIVRAELYQYRYTAFGEPGWWARERVGTYIRPLTIDDPTMQALVEQEGWAR